ncbi:MAG TPA: SusC/RagA family TonB-linked outer membrane protein [Gemmatimonadales bacterium]|nr:SusC/RagA family TonB-linked outer membrane protein [Gemmatimonadales bacterium]
MTLVRHLAPALVAGLFLAVPLSAQDSTGSIAGKVIDQTTQQPLANVEVAIPGTPLRDLSRNDGTFRVTGVRAGTQRVRATRIGYGSQFQEVTVTAGGAATVNLALVPAAAILEPVVVTGYGTQRREAITGSVSTVDAAAANRGVQTNVDQMIQGRAAGVDISQNNGEPGAGRQVLIRGGSSIGVGGATNDPLYVVDGVPINNVATEPQAMGVFGDPMLARNPLNLLNPADISSITILKDAAATAIYGSRASNGVILIETKRGQTSGGPTFEYDGYVAAASPAKRLPLLTGAEYRQFVARRVTDWRNDSTAFNGRHGPTDTVFTKHFADSAATFNALDPSLVSLGPANTDWASAITRTSVTHNHDLAFSGGNEATRYRASMNYAKEEGVTLSTGLERIQGRLSATHSDLNNRLRIGVNVTTSRVNNTYLTYENQGGFQGGVFQQMAVFNPTQPITFTDSLGTHYYDPVGSVHNPVAMANQLIDVGHSTRTLANASADLDVATGLTARVNLGLDHSSGDRQEYYPNASPVGVSLGNGLAQQQNLDNATQTIQTQLTYQRQVGDGTSLDVVGGYEYSKFRSNWVQAEGIGFFTDTYGFNNLSAAITRNASDSAYEFRLVSFFGRANVGFKDRYFLTGVLRYDGSSKFAVGHKWGLFPALSASWRLSQEKFLQGGPFSDLRLRVGWGLQGNPGVNPYTSLITLTSGSGAAYPWGDVPHAGVTPNSNGNPNLKWEQTSQVNAAVDFGLLSNRLSGSVEYYVKNTKDLLLTIDVPQPALASQQLINVGRLHNNGLEVSLDAVLVSHPGLVWRSGVVFAAERNKVTELATSTGFATGPVSGQGQSGVNAERLFPGSPLGTFFGPVFLGIDSSGKQVFFCTTAVTPTCSNGRTTTGLAPNGPDYREIGNANPDFTLGFHNQVNWGKFDISFLVRASVGGKVFNNSALVYATQGNALQGKNFLRDAVTDPTGIHEPAIFSSRWIESGTFARLQNITVSYDLDLPVLTRSARSARLYVSADNLVLLTGYSGLDPEVFSGTGTAVRGIDYLTYPRPRTVTGGLRLMF